MSDYTEDWHGWEAQEEVEAKRRPMSAGDRDTLAAVLAEHRYTYDQWMQEGQFWVKCECGEKLACGPENLSGLAHRAHVADVLLASDWLREQRTDVCDQIIERIRGMEFLGASSLALGGQVAQQEILVLIEQHKRLVPYRTTEDTDAH